MGLRDRKEFDMKKVFIGGSTRFLESVFSDVEAHQPTMFLEKTSVTKAT